MGFQKQGPNEGEDSDKMTITRRFEIHLTEPQHEVLKEVTRASGDTIERYLHDTVIGGLQSDIDLYFGHSKTMTEQLNKKLHIKENVKKEQQRPRPKISQ